MKMDVLKILHTSDWHLGQKFLYKDRFEEHQPALEWLVKLIRQEKIDILIVAGDIFDINNPPNQARQLYYRFLFQLQSTPCRHVVIVGGNHDSPNMLNAPREILRFLNIHIVGEATPDPKDSIIELKNSHNELEAVIAAVPFLRDRDIKQSFAGEANDARIERIREGLKNYYKQMKDLCRGYEQYDIPVLTTGHLYAKGAQASDIQNNIYLGDVENIGAKDFPTFFDYIALGHLHRCQKVGGADTIRYSGSLIPLSFSEIKDDKAVLLIQFEGGKMNNPIQEITVPTFRSLRSIKGTVEEIEKGLTELNEEIQEGQALSAWVEIQIESDQAFFQAEQHFKAFTAEMPFEILKIKSLFNDPSLHSLTENVQLEAISPVEVFRKKCTSFGLSEEKMDDIQKTFIELQSWMNEQN